MKKFILSIMLPAALIFTSCGGDEKSTEGDDSNSNGKDESLDLSEMEEIKLEKYDLKASVHVPQIVGPNGDVFPVVVKHEDGDYFWYIEIGDNGDRFRLIFEIADGLADDLVAEKKKMFQSFWKIDYLIDEKDVILYRLYMEEDAVPEQFHVFAQVTIDGTRFRVYSDESHQYRKKQAEDMYKTIRSIK
jgi:hypothetical protein